MKKAWKYHEFQIKDETLPLRLKNLFDNDVQGNREDRNNYM